ncbi:50S ribosomal protein L11 [Candidatus Bathyarchaeota archaeon]|nr:MAG: 50S ribosomal protein L11 [Candidatus Bathyarchaeota archaeon]
MVKKTFRVIVTAGEATGGPPIGPLIGPLGVNIMAVVNKINEMTESYKGTKVPVEITIDTDTKEFEIKVGMLTTTALILKELGIEKGSGKPNTEPVGDLSFEQVIKIAKLKREGLLASSLKAAVKEILGSCLSMGVTVEGRSAKEVLREVKEGKYDDLLEETN